MTNQIPNNEAWNVVMDGDPETAAGFCIAIMPILAFLSILYLLVRGAIKRRSLGTAAPFPTILLATSSLLIAAEIFAMVWWTGYSLFQWALSHWGKSGGYPWIGLMANFGSLLTWFAWTIPVATIGYVGAWLLRDKK